MPTTTTTTPTTTTTVPLVALATPDLAETAPVPEASAPTFPPARSTGMDDGVPTTETQAAQESPAPPPPPPGPLTSAGVIVEGLVYDMPMPWGDPDFESFRATYMTRAGQKWLAAVMTGSLSYLSYVEERIQYYGLPQELVYLPVVESDYSPTAVSRSGAVGLWQFMKNSISGYGMKIDDWVDERRDFMKSTDGALKKLADNYKALGDWPLAIAAYNAGLGAVSRALAKTGLEKPTVNDLKQQGLIAKETLGYVPKFLAVASILRYPELHGLPVSWGEPSTWQALPANQPVDLSLLAELIGIPHETLKRGNPELRKEVTPPNPHHLIKVPVDKAEAAKAILDDTSRPLIRYYTYKVKSGDNLGAIAKGYKTSIANIVEANPGLNPDKIRVEQVLRIPAYNGASPPTSVVAAASTPTSTATPAVASSAAGTATLSATLTAASSGLAEAGTLASNGTATDAGDPAATASASPAAPPIAIAAATLAPPGSGPIFSGSHTVVKGDTIWNISQRFKIKPELLAEKNGLKVGGVIKIGQVLSVPALN